MFLKGPGNTQLSQKITGIKKICKTWDLYQSILYTLEDYFLKKTKFFNTGFFFYRPISSFTLQSKVKLRGEISKKKYIFKKQNIVKLVIFYFLIPNLRKKMWSVFRYTPILHQEGQKKKRPNITLSYYQICFLPLPMQFCYKLKN